MDTQHALLEQVMKELGPQCPDVAAVVQENENSWTVQHESGSGLHLAWRGVPARLEMMVCVGAVPETSAVDVLRPLMMFNFLSAETGGTRMGLSALGNMVYLIRDLPESSIGVQPLQAAMKALMAAAGKWREFIDQSIAAGILPPLPVEALSAQV